MVSYFPKLPFTKTYVNAWSNAIGYMAIPIDNIFHLIELHLDFSNKVFAFPLSQCLIHNAMHLQLPFIANVNTV